MPIGLGIILLILGLILLTGAVSLPDVIANAIASEPLGWILTIAGALTVLVGVMLTVNRSGRSDARYPAAPPPPPQYPAGPPAPGPYQQQGQYPQGPYQGQPGDGRYPDGRG